MLPRGRNIPTGLCSGHFALEGGPSVWAAAVYGGDNSAQLGRREGSGRFERGVRARPYAARIVARFRIDVGNKSAVGLTHGRFRGVSVNILAGLMNSFLPKRRPRLSDEASRVFFVQHLAENWPTVLVGSVFFVARQVAYVNLFPATEGGIPGSPCSVTEPYAAGAKYGEGAG